jgi:hypothetical protein
MQHVLFELLENAGFLKGTAINTDRIASARRSELIVVAEQSAELTPVFPMESPTPRPTYLAVEMAGS